MEPTKLIEEYKESNFSFNEIVADFLREFKDLIDFGYEFPNYHFSGTHEMRIYSTGKFYFWKNTVLGPILNDVYEAPLPIKKQILDSLSDYREKIIKQLKKEIEIYKR